MSSTRIVIFAKAPVAGFAKTRLIPALGEEGAARLARRLLLHTVAQAIGAGVESVELCATPVPGHPDWHTLDLPPTLTWTDQGDGDLGARMARAAQRVCTAGQAVLLIGTDCPQLNAVRLRLAAEALNHRDAVVFPTADGGYALLGLRRFDASLFRGIAWSTSNVATVTMERLAKLGWRIEIGERLQDIDEPADLGALPAELRADGDEPG